MSLTRRDPQSVKVSLVVVVFDMAREAPRTLASLAPGYQTGGEDLDYDVIVVDNGSNPPLERRVVEGFGPTFRLVRIDDASPSPVSAINLGVRHSEGELVGVMIDGARLLTPGVLRHAVHAALLFRNPVIGTLGFHLGAVRHSRAREAGYDAQAEDELLDGIGWPADGYRLFEIATLAGSSKDGWFWPPAESNCVFVSRETLDRLGGFEPRFQTPGGGLANLDFWRRALALPDTTPVMLVGEGNFHQIHGGVTTGGDSDTPPLTFKQLEAEYREIRGEGFRRPSRQFELLGSAPQPALRFIEASAAQAAELHSLRPA